MATRNNNTSSNNASSSFFGVASYVAEHGGNVPILRLILGVVMVGFFLCGLLLQIQTSESFLLQGSVVGLTPNWGIAMQPILLIQGVISGNEAKGVMWGWGIELVYLVCVIGDTKVHGTWNRWFKSGAYALVAFNFWADFNYGSLPSGWGGQFAFAAITSFVVAFFGSVGFNLIWSSVSEMAQ